MSFYSHNSFLFKAILRLGGNRYQQQCDDIKEKGFGNSDKDILTELRNIEKTNDPIPKGLKGKTNVKLLFFLQLVHSLFFSNGIYIIDSNVFK